jgi:hypothetical protein
MGQGKVCYAPAPKTKKKNKHQRSEPSIEPPREEPAVAELGRRKPWSLLQKGEAAEQVGSANKRYRVWKLRAGGVGLG